MSKSFLILTALLFFSISSFFFSRKAEAAVVTNQGDITINASIYGCILNITVLPESRIFKPGGNYANLINIQIFNSSGSKVADFNIQTNNSGFGSYNLCTNAFLLQGETYSMSIKGMSHLRRRFPSVSTFYTVLSNVDLSSQSKLVAGDTFSDNFINGLDIAELVVNVYSSDLLNDLNRDGFVNSLDISIAITNYLRGGD